MSNINSILKQLIISTNLNNVQFSQVQAIPNEFKYYQTFS